MNKKLLLFLLILLLLPIFFHSFILNHLANSLVVRDKLMPADCIVVLAGDANGERVTQGVKLFNFGLSKKMLMSGGQLAWRLTSADWMRKQALFMGVPASAVITEGESASTRENALFTLPILKAHGIKSIILVTSPYHALRAKKVFQKVFAHSGIAIISYPATQSDFKANGWWLRHEDTQYVVHELFAFVLYFVKGY